MVLIHQSQQKTGKNEEKENKSKIVAEVFQYMVNQIQA